MAFDFIHFKLIQWSKNIILENLTLLFNLCFEYQICPDIWKYGEYIPVPKPGRPPQYAKNIRPIMIIPGLARIISKLNCNRLLTDCVNRRLLSARNCALIFFWLGFRKHGAGNRFQPSIVTCRSNKVIAPNTFKCI